MRATLRATQVSESADTVNMRLRAMQHVYRANFLAGNLMPRITVRASGNMGRALAYAVVGRNEIVVSEQAYELSELQLKAVIFHELVHAQFGVTGHDENCILMASRLRQTNEYTSEAIERAFVKYADRYAQSQSVNYLTTSGPASRVYRIEFKNSLTGECYAATFNAANNDDAKVKAVVALRNKAAEIRNSGVNLPFVQSYKIKAA